MYTELLSEKKTTPLIDDQDKEYMTNNIQEIKQENSPSKEYEGSSNLAEEMRQYLASLDEKLKNSSTNLWESKPLQYSQVMTSQENKGIEVSETITMPYQDSYTSPYTYQLDYSSKPIETNVSTYVMGDALGYTAPASYQPLSEDLAEDKKSVFPTDNIIGTQYTYTDYYKPSEAPLNIGEYNTQTNPIVQTDYKITTVSLVYKILSHF